MTLMPPSAMTMEPTMKLALSEARKATTFRFRGPFNRGDLAVLGEEIRAVFANTVEDIGHNIAGADRVHADAVSNTFDRQRTGELS